MTTIVQTSDSDLVLASRRGDRAAFSEIVRRYQAIISGMAYSACGNLALSEDIAQETFLSAWKSLSGLRDPGKLPAWLCQIARRRVTDHLRKSPQPSFPLVDRHADLDPTPPEQAISEEQRDLLWQNLARIPEPYRETMVMYYRQEHSAEAVAAALEISEENVRQRLTRGRQLLREQIAQMLERDLAHTAPKPQFTAAVVAALPGAIAQSTASATLAKASGASKAASLLAILGIFIGPFLAVFVGISTAVDHIRSGQTRREKRVIIENIIVVALVVAVSVTVLLLVRAFWNLDGLDIFKAQTIFWITITAILVPLTIWGARRHRAIRRAEGLEDRVPVASGRSFFLAGSCAVLGSQLPALSMAIRAGDVIGATLIGAFIVSAEIAMFIQIRRMNDRTSQPNMILHMLTVAAICFLEANFRLPMWYAKLNGLTVEQSLAQFPRLQLNVFLAAVFGFGFAMAVTQLMIYRKAKSSGM